ncbi:MAG TPA: hypothetical protein VFF68_08990, partial [Anaerolineaceae bacterium]|nr:hypothetical protein [Anaerolineaceae bacterium]
PRSLDETFPWDHISPAVKKSYLKAEFRNSQSLILRQDCRQQCFACGILPTFASIRRASPSSHWKCPEVSRRSAKTLVEA